MSEQVNTGGRGNKLAVVGAVAVLTLGALGYGVYTLTHAKSGKLKKQPKITLLAPALPPPPPPPPPKFEKKPEPPKEQKEMKIERPVENKVVQAPSPELKMDGPAGDGPSAFSAGKITSEDISKLGTGKAVAEKTGMFNPFNNYASLAKGELQRHLAKNNALRRRVYTIEVHVWVAPSGALQRFELVGSSNDSDTDEAIRATLASLPSFSQSLPANMPQPIRLRIKTGA